MWGEPPTSPRSMKGAIAIVRRKIRFLERLRMQPLLEQLVLSPNQAIFRRRGEAKVLALSGERRAFERRGVSSLRPV